MNNDEANPAKPRRKRRQPRKATAQSLRNAALHYLERYASSSENLRRVLMRRVERSARFHGTDRAEGAERVDEIIRRFIETGLLDDNAYAEGRLQTLRRRGASTRLVRAQLAAKGVAAETIEHTLAREENDAEDEDAEWAAARRFARRRRLGPFRAPKTRAEMRERDLAALARAGFSFDMARRVIEAEDD